MRCKECGDVRWSFSALKLEPKGRSCVMCGGEMVAERRIPGRPRAALDTERRDAGFDRPRPST